jgi:hypothetical protein
MSKFNIEIWFDLIDTSFIQCKLKVCKKLDLLFEKIYIYKEKIQRKKQFWLINLAGL